MLFIFIAFGDFHLSFPRFPPVSRHRYLLVLSNVFGWFRSIQFFFIVPTSTHCSLVLELGLGTYRGRAIALLRAQRDPLLLLLFTTHIILSALEISEDPDALRHDSVAFNSRHRRENIIQNQTKERPTNSVDDYIEQNSMIQVIATTVITCLAVGMLLCWDVFTAERHQQQQQQQRTSNKEKYKNDRSRQTMC